MLHGPNFDILISLSDVHGSFQSDARNAKVHHIRGNSYQPKQLKDNELLESGQDFVFKTSNEIRWRFIVYSQDKEIF